MTEQQLRQQIIDYARQLNSSGLSIGKSGNLSQRYQNGCLITPSGLDYQSLTIDDIVWLDLQGKPGPEQQRLPSSEWHFHCELYRCQPDIGAIVHAHPTYSTALACTGSNIPAFHYMVAVAGGKQVPLIPYALFGTEQLSRLISLTLQHYHAALLANHGMIATGTSLNHAFKLAEEIEALARQYCETLKIGQPILLTDEQMDQVLEKFKHYGQRV